MADFMKLKNRANPHEYWGFRVFELWKQWDQPLVPKASALPGELHLEMVVDFAQKWVYAIAEKGECAKMKFLISA